MQKGFAVSLLLLTVLVIGGLIGYLIFSKSIQEDNLETPIKFAERSENLKTYTNKSLGFEFQYLKDLKVVEDSEENFHKRGNGNFRKNFTYYVTYPPAKVLGIAAVLDSSNNFDKNPLTLWVFENLENLTVKDWYDKYWYYPFVWGDYTSRRENVAPTQDATISGKLAKYGVVTYQPEKPKYLYLSDNNKMYLFRINGETGDQILSTVDIYQ